MLTLSDEHITEDYKTLHWHFMGEVEYIPGDLVKIQPTANWFAKDDDILKVTGSGVGRYVNVIIANEEEYIHRDYNVYNGDIMPIPITSSLLEANGWEKKIKDNRTFYYNKECRIVLGHFNTMHQPTNYRVYYEDKCTSLVIHSVHQFQHLLYGFGVTYSLKV